MSELLPEDEALLEQARLGLEPSSEDHARIKRRVLAQVGVTAAALTTASSATGAATFAGSMTAATLTKVAAAVLVASGIAGGAYWQHTHDAPMPAPPTAYTSNPDAPAARPSTLSPRRTDRNAAPTEATSPLPVAPPLSANASVPPRSITTSTSPIRSVATTPVSSHPQPEPAAAGGAPAVVSGPQTLMVERELLQQASDALNQGDPNGALAALNRHAQLFPDGVLAEEREAERIVVLCTLGRPSEAKTAADHFVARYPRSPSIVRIRSSCAGP
jgi:hypothetical protein